MRWWMRIISMLRLVAGGRRANHEDREMREEMAFHLDMHASRLRDMGLSDDDARRAAALAFGGTAQWSEASRDEYRSRPLEEFARDVRYGIRSLRRQPAFTVTVILILAIGIGANTATFAVIDALMLRALPVPHPEQLVSIGDPAGVYSSWSGSPSTDYASYPLYTDVRDHTHTLSGLYASGAIGLDVLAAGAVRDPSAEPEHPNGRIVSGNFFSVLGVAAHAGRTFTADDDRVPRGNPVAVISDAYWQRRFNGARSAIGTTLLMNDVEITIVGVMPPGFTGDVVGTSIDIWVPMMLQPALQPRNVLDDRSRSWLQVMGRLAPGATLERARAELAAIETQSIRAHLSGADLSSFDDDVKTSPVRVESAARGFSRERNTYAAALTVLMAAVVLLLLVVCANVSNLMLTRAIARGREMTVRMTLGAGRRRLVQQLMTESLLLASAAASAGLVAATWGGRLLIAVAGGSGDRIRLDLAPTAAAFAFVTGLTVACTVAFGLLPALRATRMDLSTALKAQGRSLAGGRSRVGRFATAKLLVVGQVALSAVLLIGAGLLVRSMQHIVSADLGLDREHLLIAHVLTSKAGYTGARMNMLVRDLAARSERIPGVSQVTYSAQGIFNGGMSTTRVTVAGFVPRADSERAVNRDDVGPRYFTTMGAHMLRGRDFDARDAENSARVAVIDQTMANAYFGGTDPIGRTFVAEDEGTFTIVGVVRDVQENDLRAKPVRRFYASIFQSRDAAPTLVLEVRSKSGPALLVEPIRAAILGADRRLGVEIAPLDDLVRDSVAQDVLLMRVTAFFGAMALLVVALGLYGVTSYATLQRTSEFGVRMALGAESSAVARLVIGEALALAVLGIAIGIPAGLCAAHAIRGQIFGIAETDPPSIVAAAALLCVMAVASSYLPARRAARIGPLDALREG